MGFLMVVLVALVAGCLVKLRSIHYELRHLRGQLNELRTPKEEQPQPESQTQRELIVHKTWSLHEEPTLPGSRPDLKETIS